VKDALQGPGGRFFERRFARLNARFKKERKGKI
jgi:hypothetical protein